MTSLEDLVQDQHLLPTDSRNVSSKTIEDLTDDALFLIFKYVNCTELSNSISAVCRRWHCLAFHHAVWVHRHIKPTEIGGTAILNKILSNVPAVHTLDLTQTTVEESTLQTILHSNIKIRNLKLHDCTIKPDSHCSVVTVLHYLSKNLEGLSIMLNDDLIRSCNEFNLNDMKNLRRLTLIGDIYLDATLRKLNLKNPYLECLDVSRFNSQTYIYSDARRYAFISNLINETCRSLKELHLPTYINKTILNSVKKCNFLTNISLQFEYIAVVSHLPFIKTLIIYCDSSENPPLAWTRPKELNELVLHLRRPKDSSVSFLRNIKPISLTLVSDNLCKELEKYYSENIERLTLRCYFLRLRHLHKISSESLLPHIKYLDVRGCFLGRGIPQKISVRLKRRFPQLTVRSNRFVSYKKTRELRDDVECSIDDSTDCSDTE